MGFVQWHSASHTRRRCGPFRRKDGDHGGTHGKAAGNQELAELVRRKLRKANEGRQGQILELFSEVIVYLVARRGFSVNEVWQLTPRQIVHWMVLIDRFEEKWDKASKK